VIGYRDAVGVTIRPIEESEYGLFSRCLARTFGFDHNEEVSARFRSLLDLQRTVVAFDGSDLIGTCAAFSYHVTVPGGAVPMGGTTVVTVQPTHRRRGVLRAMMAEHLEEIAGRGEPLAGLWASESSIYGRFGFGIAALQHRVKIDARAVEFREPAPRGGVGILEADDAGRLLPDVFERVRPSRPGMLTRTESWWTNRVLFDPEFRRGGATARRFVAFSGDDGLEGYAMYRQSRDADSMTGEVVLQELIAATPAAHHGLWRFLLRLDLFPSLRYWNMPVDDELPWRVTDPRRVERSIVDSLWLRILDVPKALAGRRYRSGGTVVIEVEDAFRPATAGRFALEASADGASCAPTTAPPDVTLPVDVLSSIYLGAPMLPAFARAGVASGAPEAIDLIHRLFTWDPQPWCQEVF